MSKLEMNNMKQDILNLFKDIKILDEADNKIVDKVDRALLRLTNGINYLNDSQRYLAEWVEALNFLHWFNWNKMHSKKLVEEAKNKLYKELEYVQCGSIIPQKLEWDDITIKEKQDKQTGIGYIKCDANACLRSCYDYTPTVNEIRLGNKTLYLEDPTPKYEYKDYVKAVVAAPYKFDKKVCYNVYRYLKEILNKDITVKEYTN